MFVLLWFLIGGAVLLCVVAAGVILLNRPLKLGAWESGGLNRQQRRALRHLHRDIR